MKFVKIPPPGTWCMNQAVRELVEIASAQTFVEVGCGAGSLSKYLCDHGLTGCGIDMSAKALNEARSTLRKEIADQKYSLIQGSLFELPPVNEKFDVGICLMVLEHVEDEKAFLQKMVALIKPKGHIIIGVPGRKDRWSIEDETVGHLRRYERKELSARLSSIGAKNILVRSISVPISNILFNVGKALIKRSSEMQKLGKSQKEQTLESGIQEIPFKTVFPAFFKIFLNHYTMYPLLLLQKVFYNTDLGLTIIAMGEISADLQTEP